ncbi:MAG: hypothetical protein ACO2OR_01785 [Desulfurococcaceae archaeon]
MGRAKKKAPREAVKEESLFKWIIDPKNPAYLKKKLLEAIEEGT